MTSSHRGEPQGHMLAAPISAASLQQQPRPLFLYGTLRALPLLAWAVTGDARKVDAVKPLVQPARILGFARFALHGKDYPALVRTTPEDAENKGSAVVDGLLFRPRDRSQRRKLDDFEGETYEVMPVFAQVQAVDATMGSNSHWDEGEGELVDADVYLWNGDPEAVSTEEWDLNVFIRERLDDWLDLFAGIEMTGDDV